MTGLRLLRALLLIVLCLPAHAADVPFDAMRLKWRDIILPQSGIDTNDPAYTAWAASSGGTAQTHWNSLQTNAAFLWTDLSGLATNSSHISASYTRLRAMALGYAIPGSGVHGNGALFNSLTNALDWLYRNYYNETNVIYDNWFDWEVSSALSLNDITVLLYDELAPQQIANYMAAVYHYTPAPDYTSANKVWKASVVAVRGVITHNETNLVAARDALSDVFPYVASGEGFYTDGSFIFHDVFPYNGHYGVKLIETLGPLMQLLKSSPWEVTDPAQTNLFRWICDSFEPFMYEGAMMQMVSGRAYTRTGDDHADGHDAIAAILRIAQFAEASEAAIYKATIKYWLTADRYTDFVATRGVPYNLWAKQVRDDIDVVSRGPLLGHFQFPRMERTVHARPGWAFGLAMSSKRVGNYESLRGENLRGWHTGDGMTYLYNSDQGHYADKFWPTVNPYRLPGTTVDAQMVRTNGSGQDYLSPNHWSGGASLGPAFGELNGRQDVGVAGMILRGWNSSLTARKSWFMFDDEVVCLGAAISADDGHRIETIVENRLLAGHGNNDLVVNGVAKSPLVGWSETMASVSWAHLAGNTPGSDIGYYFPSATTVKGSRESRGGSFYDLNTKFGSTNAYSRNYLTLWLDHGVDPSGTTYRYVLLPGKTTNEVAAYAQSPDIVVLRNNSDAHAVQETRLNVTAVNFWRDMSNRIANIYTDRRSSVVVRDSGGIIDVGITDPIHTNAGVMSFEYSGTASAVLEADPAITVVRLSPSIRCTIDLTNASGRCFRARFYTGPVQTLTNFAVADAYVQNGDQSVSNFGANATLALKSSATTLAREAYLRFQLPTAAQFLGATLRLATITKNDPVLYHGLSFVPDNTWTEMGITWDNKPASEPQFTTWALPNLGTPAVVPITELAQRAIDGDGQLSLRLFSTGAPPPTNGFAAYGSRENSLTNRPFLSAEFGEVAPSVSLTAPTANNVWTAPATVSIVALAWDFDGIVTNVDLFQGAARMARRPSPPYSVTVTNLAAGTYTYTAVATDNAGLTTTSAPVAITVYGAEPAGSGTGLIGEYYGTENFTGLGFTRTDPQINFDWAAGSPGGSVPINRFSVRWSGRLQARRAGTHSFSLVSDNGARLWLDGRVVIDDMVSHNLAEKSGTISLIAGQYYDLAVEYYDLTGPAAVQLYWQEPGAEKQLVPQSQLYPVLNGLVGTYFAGTNLNLTNAVFTRVDEAVNFAWGNSSPDEVLLPDSFSVRWTGKVLANVSGVHSFYTTSDDGVRLRIGTQTIISNWAIRGTVQHTGTVSLVAGQLYDLNLEYFNAGSNATIVLSWAPPGHAKQLLTSANLTPYNYNQPPAIDLEGFVRVTRGSNMTLNAGASDLDLPAQTLTFSLDAGSPSWAGISSSSGALTLAPALATPVGVYLFGVRVKDNGVPSMTDAQNISVLVTDDIIAPVTLIGTASVWRYFDGGVDQGIAWRSPYFNDTAWARGPAPLGYNSGAATTVSYGPSSSSKYVTTYFRRPFFVPDVSALQTLDLRMISNDGVVLYVNGSELLRDNLPSSTIAYTTFASRRINDATNIVTTALDPSWLFDGLNVVAAEIHQNAVNGADIFFELELKGSAFVPRDVPIQIMPGPSGVTLLWPAQAGLLSLCSATSLVPPIVWTPVELFGPSPLDIQHPYCFLDLAAPTNQTLFFRLQSP